MTISGSVFSYPHSVTFSCQPGFNLKGAAHLQCLANGSWETSIPSCEPVVCPTLRSPFNAKLSSVNSTYSAKISVTCESGYKVVGEEIVTCLASGLWDNPLPSCEPIQCDMFQVPVHSEVVSANLSFQGTVKLRCAEGFIQHDGSLIKTCAANRQWVGDDPVCKGTCCSELKLCLHFCL